MTEPTRISYSERKTYKTCRRKWWFTYYRRLALLREEPGAASLGTRVHAALQIHYDPTDLRLPMEVFAMEAEADLADPDVHEKTAAEIELAEIMLTGYFDWLEETGADEDYELLAAESSLEMEAEEIEGVVFIGKIDARVRRRSDGAVLFVDHKTVISFEEKTRLLHLDEQMKTYHILESAALGEETRVDGAIYNMLRKVKRSPRAKPPFYERAEVRHNPHVLDSYRRQMIGEASAIMKTRAALDAGKDPITTVPPNPSRDCAWMCEFLPICPMQDDQSMAAERVENQFYGTRDPLERYKKEKENPAV